MKVKFYGQPNQLVRDKKTGRPLLRFDANGEYITEDENLITRMKARFDSVGVGEKQGDDGQIPLHICPVCGFEANSKAGLTAHVRAKHKSEEG
ncbi:MAG: hypothetical protein ACM3PP_06730 [Candidatus Saccharibacteria bacterium]